MQSRLTVLPLLLVIAVYAVVGPTPVLGGVLTVLVLTPLLMRRRLALGRTLELALSVHVVALIGVVLALALRSPIRMPGVLRAGWAALGGALLLLAALRLYLARSAGGDNVTLALALVALAACGGTYSGMLYPGAVAAFVATAIFARYRADRGRPPPRALGLRHLGALGGGLLVAAVVAGAWMSVLPTMHGWFVQQIMLRAGPRAGFSNQLWLGSMESLLLSSKRVLRVHGEPVDYLRGVVYAEYDGLGRWSRLPEDSMRVTHVPRALEQSDGVTEIEHIEREPDHYFVPLRVNEVALPTGVARADRAGIFAPLAAAPADRLWFANAPDDNRRLSPPSPAELAVPRRMLGALRPIADEWTAGSTSDIDRLRALERHLQVEFEYSLAFDRPAGRDPVMSFLLHDRRGHCEYFATAMVLLSRSLGIPARVVGGYRVTEHNPVGGYYIVRERNAHAWVEAYVGDWYTFDPTPQAGLMEAASSTTPMLASIGDLLSHGLSLFLSWLDKRSPAQVLTAPVVLVLLFVLVRWLRSRQQRRVLEGRGRDDEPLPCFVQLCEALERLGVARPSSETLELFAQRLARHERATAREAAALVTDYAALRYGALGAEDDIETRMRKLTARLRSGDAET